MSTPWIAAFAGLAALVILLGLLVLGTLRRISPILEKAESKLLLMPSDLAPAGLAPGTPVPDFQAQDLNGSAFRAVDLRGTEGIVLFLDSDCEPCRTLTSEVVADNGGGLDARLTVVVDSRADGLELDRIPGITVLHQVDREVARAFQSSVAPHAFAISAAGTVVETGNPNTLKDLQAIAHRIKGGGDRTAGTGEHSVHGTRLAQEGG